jgi:hypothetical protein
MTQVSSCSSMPGASLFHFPPLHNNPPFLQNPLVPLSGSPPRKASTRSTLMVLQKEIQDTRAMVRS